MGKAQKREIEPKVNASLLEEGLALLFILLKKIHKSRSLGLKCLSDKSSQTKYQDSLTSEPVS